MAKLYAVRAMDNLEQSYRYILKKSWHGYQFSKTPKLLFNSFDGAAAFMNKFAQANARTNSGRVTYDLDIVELSEKVVFKYVDLFKSRW
ncbi:hypothetical protein WOSG25_290020 [Weissella oryzae SG25]|uniref:Uncharacterized protein n=1 Tax=Weissella oryzae (strain DSM 25784 / JCM 18191 / LMG 30913 / SG25) TaxID=1329250 RepID=A0A069CXT4_WEIOS|nr:hypothetical protein [Weissella oryzae]GAK32068.1 hypothetical protein WOSG25_290020 [Weissella oryzae SG25]